MDPTLTLEIPFLFLGLNDIKSSNYIPTIHQRSKPLEYIHATLLALCPDIPVRLIPSSAQTTPDIPWHIYPSPLDEAAILTVDERTKVSENTWSCPAILQRSGIPINTSDTAWTLFILQAREIFSALGQMHAYQEQEVVYGETVHSRPWSLVTPSQAQLRISLAPTRPEMGIRPNLVKNVMMLAAGLERELTLLTTPAALLRYWSVSRFLEYRAVREGGRERVGLWARFAGTGEGTREKEKMKWSVPFDEEDSVIQRTKGRGREWWDIINSADIHTLLCDTQTFLKTGRMLCIEPVFTAGNEKVTALTFQHFHSTLDAQGVVAYTELTAGLAHMACDFSHAQVDEWLGGYRQVSPFASDPRDGFGKLLGALHVSGPSMAFFESYLDTLYSTNASAPSPELPTSLFDPMASHIATTLSSERAYIPTFIERYTAAGGFRPTPTSKVYALMMADEQLRTKTKKTRGDGDWLGGVEEVGVGDSEDRNGVEDLDGSFVGSPGEGDGEGERVELGRRVREGLYR